MELNGVPKSSEHYARADGKSCPVCGGADLDRAPPSCAESGAIIAWVGCEGCRHVWLENYRLTGYSDLESPRLPDAAP